MNRDEKLKKRQLIRLRKENFATSCAIKACVCGERMHVIDARQAKDSYRRRYVCESCGKRKTTYEFEKMAAKEALTLAKKNDQNLEEMKSKLLKAIGENSLIMNDITKRIKGA